MDGWIVGRQSHPIYANLQPIFEILSLVVTRTELKRWKIELCLLG